LVKLFSQSKFASRNGKQTVNAREDNISIWKLRTLGKPMERVEPSTMQADAKLGPATHTGPETVARLDVGQRKTAERFGTADNPIDLQLHALEMIPRANRWAFTLAGAFCLFWAGTLMAYAAGYAATPGGQALGLSWWLLMGGAIVVPCIMAWFLAVLVRETRALRAQSRAIAHVAGVLIQPDDAAAKGLERLSQTLRRELDGFNAGVETAYAKLVQLQSANRERLTSAEQSIAQAEDRIGQAALKLSAERDKLQGFSQSLEQAVSGVAETLGLRVSDARAAARAAAEGLEAEQNAINALLGQLSGASEQSAARAAAMAQEFERQSQRLESAAEAASARSENVMQRHERHRTALAETLDRMKAENDNMTRALEGQRDSIAKLVAAIGEEAKRVDAMAADGVRRIDTATSGIAQRVTEATQALTAEIDRLKTQSELSSTGIGAAMAQIKAAGDTSYDSASKLGAQLGALRESAARASEEVDAGIARLQQMMADLPRDVSSHAEQLRGVIEGQALAINDLSGRIANAFDNLQSLEQQQAAKPAGSPHASTAVPQPAPPQQASLAAPATPQAPVLAAPAPAATNLPAPAPQATARQVSPLSERILNAAPPTPTASPGADPQSPKPDAAATQELKGWLGIAKRLVRLSGPDEQINDPVGPPRNWEMKQLLNAAEQAGQPETAQATAARHAIESLQSLAIDIDRFLEDDPPLDYLRRYRAGERDIFARRLVQVMSRDTNERLIRKHKNDAEFREAVDRFCAQFEALMADIQTASGDPARAEATLNSAVGRAYMALARISGKI
jgi:hypothetical protein